MRYYKGMYYTVIVLVCLLLCSCSSNIADKTVLVFSEKNNVAAIQGKKGKDWKYLDREEESNGNGHDNGGGNYDLELLGFSFPEDIAIGDQILLNGTIQNNGPGAYVGSGINIAMVVNNDIGVADISFISNPELTHLSKNETIDVILTVDIDNDLFRTASENIIIIWPTSIDTGSSTDIDSTNDAVAHTVYVLP